MPPPSHNDDVLLGESRDYIHCDNEDCNKPGARKRCTGCKCAFYCSIACQRADWKSQHKQVCKRMQRQNTQTTVAMQADQIDAGGAAAATATTTDTTSDVDVCAICLGPPVAPCPLPDCQHEFCYACLGELQTSAIASSTMPVEENMPCPLCRKPSVPFGYFVLHGRCSPSVHEPCRTDSSAQKLLRTHCRSNNAGGTDCRRRNIG